MQQPRISAHPRSQQQTYLLTLPKPIQFSKHRDENRRTGLSGASEVQRSLRKTTSQPFLTRTSAPLSIVSLQCPSNLTHPSSTPAISIASSDTKTLHSSTSTDKDFPSTIAEPSASLQPSPFPPRSFFAYRSKLLTFEERLSYGQYPPSHFDHVTWKKMWSSREVDLDDLSFTIELPSKSRLLHSTSFRYEAEFTGYFYRVAINPTRCHSNMRIQCGTIVNVANLNTARGKYVVDACQLTRDGLSYFPVHYREYDQAFTSADDSCHYSFVLAIPSNFTSVSDSLLLQFLLKSKPTRSYLPFAKLKYFFAPVRHCFSLRNDQENQNATPRTSTEMDFRPPSSPQSQTSDNFLDFAEEDTPAERQRKHDFWFARS